MTQEEKNVINVEKTEKVDIQMKPEVEDNKTENIKTEPEDTQEQQQPKDEDINIEYEVYGKEVHDEAKKTVDSILGDIFSNLKSKQNEFNKTVEDLKSNKPAFDVLTTTENLIIKVDLPRITKDDLDVKISTEAVEIDANFPDDMEEYDDNIKILRRNRCSGLTKTIIPLPEEVAINEVKADFENNVLTITVPKIKGRKVDVEIV